ncbi:type III polyketide synthase [Acidimangrovimonas sediminis]|uniref:type III polyketide synthase n=1 Tax=Acidimangrovimonas sediminis TaxID=2056283 RepID=UPI000C80DD59|nr:type III polyketide synthase [Acidimangrovimonas sediminis]
MPVHLHAISTAVPPNILDQAEVARNARRLLAPRFPQFDRVAGAFESAGIARRHSVVPLDWFEEPHGWADRNARYMEGATDLFAAAAETALSRAGWHAEEVDCVVTVSSTGLATPTLEAQALRRVGFRTDILRVPLFGLGCAGGVSGAIVARRMALSQPGAKVLMVVVEACTLSFRTDRLTKADIVATVLFGDGAAALCLSTDAPDGPAITLGTPHQHTWPDTLPIMGWEVEDTGLGVIFDRSIPDFVGQEFASVAGHALERAGLSRTGVDRFVCHPGGTRVIEALEQVLHLDQGSLDAERRVLRDHGNMSAPTVLFVLEEVLRSGCEGHLLACALGPGFSAAFLPVRVATNARQAA